MPTKLKPNQVATLANLVHQAVTRFPSKSIIDWSHEIDSTTHGLMEDWEKFLAAEINKRPRVFPPYEELQSAHSDILEFLVEYYVPAPTLTDNLPAWPETLSPV